MSMIHKAFVFDYDSFDRELRELLEIALATSSSVSLVRFINDNIDILTDPYEGDPLDDSWEALIETRDPHQYGDFALTKYYRVSDDIGLGADWESVQDNVSSQSLSTSPILGVVAGPAANVFDPGKMGSYFQSRADVIANHEYTLARSKHFQTVHALAKAAEMLSKARAARRGLYVTF